MAILPQRELFSWNQVDASSDLDRLRLALEAMPVSRISSLNAPKNTCCRAYVAVTSNSSR